VDILLRQVHVLRKVCGFTHQDAMALTLSERCDWIGISNAMNDEAAARTP